jgi:hypothetical protein
MINNWNISQKEFANRKISKISEQSKLTDQCDTHSLVCFRSGKKYKIIRCGTYMPTNQTSSSQEIDEDDFVDILKTRFAKGEREK